MQEYYSEAVVLNKGESNGLDNRISLFTKKFGKLIAKTKSSRKITSKLSGHLEPGSFVRARLVEKNGLQIVDVLKESKLDISPADLYYFDKILAEAEPDSRLWEMLMAISDKAKLRQEKFRWPLIFKILGWDPKEANCIVCKSGKPAYFYIAGQNFFCEKCSSRIPTDELIYIHIQ